jgi:heat shock protein HtpX
MRRKAYGRDRGLSARLFLTLFLLGALYVVFFVVLVQFFNLGVVPIVILLGGIAFVQYYTSDRIALAAAGAKVVTPDEPALSQRRRRPGRSRPDTQFQL